MPLPSAGAPQFKKTEVVRVDVYYLGNERFGTIELHNMHIIDFQDAAKAHPHDWALVEAIESLPQFKPFTMPHGPRDPKLIDKRNIPRWPTPEQLRTEPPPMVEMIPMHEKRGPGGGLLFPHER